MLNPRQFSLGGLILLLTVLSSIGGIVYYRWNVLPELFVLWTFYLMSRSLNPSNRVESVLMVFLFVLLGAFIAFVIVIRSG